MDWRCTGINSGAAGGIQTFFNFKKNYEGHRQVGNEYLAIARECERLIALYFDRILDLEHLSNKVSELNTRYSEINQRAEEFIVSDKVYRQAMQIQNQKASREPSLVERMRKLQSRSHVEAKIGSQTSTIEHP
ncbi:SLATT domain-containing protein [Microbulbifer sp. MLAF003]|uniref:SLATT domain-containing protein n=1 Tax=Microbulbifer sp. MLAF003 TaxID=3032582 RepID=UPI0024ADEB9A|nr:SLATT domain-containing protein [Microbulbifer sp. MLAF003]WHI52322.1 SLATT domain-containing protein [Microbulbifer sp. MLAF003]